MKRVVILLALVVAGAVAWRALGGEPRVTLAQGVRLERGTMPEPRPASEVSFFAVGDTGNKTSDQARVAGAMADLAATVEPDCVLLLGDNFYPDGVSSVEDEKFRTHFEESYAFASLDVPFRPVLGNHDHPANIQAQVEYSARSTRWRMPGFYYAFRLETEDGLVVDFFALDTQTIRLKDRIAESQIRWLEDKLSRSDARWKIVFGHHPAYSTGSKGGSSTLRKRVAGLFDRYGVDAYLSGHDHNLQVLHTGRPWVQVVSGSGSSTNELGIEEHTLFGAQELGFFWILVRADELWIQAFAESGPGPAFRLVKRLH